jgi:hypothetical protein
MSPFLLDRVGPPQYQHTPDHRAVLTAAVDKVSRTSALYSEALADQKSANGALALDAYRLQHDTTALWAGGDSAGAEKLEHEIEERRPKLLADKARAERRIPVAQQALETARNELEQTRIALLPYLVVDVEDEQVAAFEEVQKRAVAVLAELAEAHARLDRAHKPLKPALTAHVEGTEHYPGDGRLAKVIRIPQLPIDWQAVSELARFNPRSVAMQAVLDTHSK